MTEPPLNRPAEAPPAARPAGVPRAAAAEVTPAGAAEAPPAAGAGLAARLGAHTIIWAVAAVLVTLIVVGGIVAYSIITTPHRLATDTERIGGKIADHLEGLAGKVYDRLKDGLRPLVTVRTSVTSQFTRIDSTPKLVVMTDTIAVDITRTSEKRAIWGLLNLGTTEVRLKAPGNKVQFYIPIGQLEAEDFSFDRARRRIVIRVPAPILDRDIVEVQSDPAKIEVETHVGWARLSAYSGKALEAKAREGLRDEVLRTADSQAMHEIARTKAEKTLRTFFGDLESSFLDGVGIEFQFKPAPPPDEPKTP